jgi:hypothetical protein
MKEPATRWPLATMIKVRPAREEQEKGLECFKEIGGYKEKLL